MNHLLQKFTIKLFLLLIISTTAYSQQMDEQGIYLSAEKMPALVGGLAQIGKKIRYPKISRFSALNNK